MPLTEKEREELDARARRGETVVPGGKGGKSLEAQESLAQARMRGGRTRKEQLGVEGFRELGRSGGRSGGGRTKGYRDLGPYGGLSKGSKSRHGSTSFPGVAATDESNILHASGSFAPPNDTNYLQHSSTQVSPSASFTPKDDSQSSNNVVNEN